MQIGIYYRGKCGRVQVGWGLLAIGRIPVCRQRLFSLKVEPLTRASNLKPDQYINDCILVDLDEIIPPNLPLPLSELKVVTISYQVSQSDAVYLRTLQSQPAVLDFSKLGAISYHVSIF